MAMTCPAIEGIPRVVCCAYFCTSPTSLVGNCVGFNFRSDVGQCDFYTSVLRSSFSTQSGCTYYSVIATRSEVVVVTNPETASPPATTAGITDTSARVNFTLTAAGLSSAAGTTPGVPGTPNIVAALTNNNGLTALALLNGQLFVTQYGDNGVSVYNTTSLQLLRKITSSGFGYSLVGLATSASNNYLYIADQTFVRRVDLSVTSITNVTTWSFTSPPQKLSLTNSGNVLVLTSDNAISEYTPSGSLVRKFTDGSQVNYAMEVGNGAWVYTVSSPTTGIRMAMNGTVMKQWGSAAGSAINQMTWPNGLAVDAQGYILVADTSNSRILVVNPLLTDARLLLIKASSNLNYPFALALDQSSGRLYVGECNGYNRLLVFDNVTNLFALFSN